VSRKAITFDGLLQGTVKEHEMIGKAPGAARILGSLRSENGKGVVRMEHRFETDIDDLWSALTDPARLARWLGDVEGDLRQGGDFRARFVTTGWEGTGRVETCEPPRRLLVRSRATGESDELVDEAVLTADGDRTILVLEERGMPLEQIAAYGVGVQLNIEDLIAYIAGGERVEAEARVAELMPAYRELAAHLD